MSCDWPMDVSMMRERVEAYSIQYLKIKSTVLMYNFHGESLTWHVCNVVIPVSCALSLVKSLTPPNNFFKCVVESTSILFIFSGTLIY